MNIKKDVEVLTKQVKEISSIYHYAAKKYGLSDGEFCVLYSLIIMNDEFTQKNLCDIWSFPKQTVNSIINNLIKKDYVVLEIKDDSNKKVIKLTDSGLKYTENIINKIFAAEKKALQMMSEEDRKLFVELSTLYTKNLREAMYE